MPMRIINDDGTARQGTALVLGTGLTCTEDSTGRMLLNLSTESSGGGGTSLLRLAYDDFGGLDGAAVDGRVAPVGFGTWRSFPTSAGLVVGSSTFQAPLADNAQIEGTALMVAPTASSWVYHTPPSPATPPTTAFRFKRNNGASLPAATSHGVRSDYTGWPNVHFELYGEWVRSTTDAFSQAYGLFCCTTATDSSGYRLQWIRATATTCSLSLSMTGSTTYTVTPNFTVLAGAEFPRAGITVLANNDIQVWTEPVGGGTRTVHGTRTPTVDLRAQLYAGFFGTNLFIGTPSTMTLKLWEYKDLNVSPVLIASNRAALPTTSSWIMATNSLVDDDFDYYGDFVNKANGVGDGPTLHWWNTSASPTTASPGLYVQRVSSNRFSVQYRNGAETLTFADGTTTPTSLIWSLDAGLRIGVTVLAGALTAWSCPLGGGTRTYYGTAQTPATDLRGAGRLIYGASAVHAEWIDALEVLRAQAVAVVFSGTGSPEGVVTAASGSIYIQLDAAGPFMWIKQTGTGATGWQPANARRMTTTLFTTVIADNVTDVLSFPMGRAWMLANISTDYAARVRLYSNIAARATDMSRAIGTDPTAGTGVLGEFVTTPAVLSIPVSPVAVGFNLESPITVNTPVTVTNLSGVTQAITVTLTYFVLEL